MRVSGPLTVDRPWEAAVSKGRGWGILTSPLTEPSKGISYPVGDLCRRFTKLTCTSVYTLNSNLIPPTDRTNGLL